MRITRLVHELSAISIEVAGRLPSSKVSFRPSFAKNRGGMRDTVAWTEFRQKVKM